MKYGKSQKGCESMKKQKSIGQTLLEYIAFVGVSVGWGVMLGYCIGWP